MIGTLIQQHRLILRIAQHFACLGYNILFDNLGFISLMICITTGWNCRVFLASQSTIVCFLLFQLDWIKYFMTTLRSTISWQKWLAGIFSNYDVLLATGWSAILVGLPLLKIILLRLCILPLLARCFHGSLKATLSRHSLRIRILGCVRQT